MDSGNIKEIVIFLQHNLSFKRHAHCMSTAAMAEILAVLKGQDREKSFFAGLVHDLAREFSTTHQQALLKQSLVELPDSIGNTPSVWHGPAAAVYLNKEFGIEDRQILEAISWHTIGHPQMDEIAKIVYIADYIESLRKHISPEFREQCISMNTNRALLYILEHEIHYYQQQGFSVFPETIILAEKLKAAEQL